MTQGEQVQITNKEYHSRPEISKSDLDVASRSGKHFCFKKETQADKTKQKEPTPAMRIGSAFHTQVLEPHLFEKEYVFAPEDLSMRTKEGKKWKEEQKELNKTILTKEEGIIVAGMADSLVSSKVATNLFNNKGTAEQSFFWADSQTNLGCKCRPDFLFDDGSTIVDLKTTADASYKGFLKSISNFRYHVQAGWYMHGLEQATGTRPKRFIFVAVEKTAPYAVGVYEADVYMCVNGFEQSMVDLKRISKWMKDEYFPNYTEDIQQISLPPWMTGAVKGKAPAGYDSIPDITLF